MIVKKLRFAKLGNSAYKGGYFRKFLENKVNDKYFLVKPQFNFALHSLRDEFKN